MAVGSRRSEVISVITRLPLPPASAPNVLNPMVVGLLVRASAIARRMPEQRAG